MKKFLLLSSVLSLPFAVAWGQSVPSPADPSSSDPSGAIAQNLIWTPAQWIAAWKTKADAVNGVLVNPTLSGASIVGTITGNQVIPNSALINNSLTVAGHQIALGGTQALNCGDLTGSGAGCLAGTMTSFVGGLVPTPPNDTTKFLSGAGTFLSPPPGTVTQVTVNAANGLGGSVATGTSTPALTLSTSVNGVAKGNGTAFSTATAGTDYVFPGIRQTSAAASPTAPNNTGALVMQGLAVAATPTGSGIFLIIVNGTVVASSSTTVNNGIQYRISYGTGTAPTSNAAVTGTQVGATQSYTSAIAPTAAADVHVPFSLNTVVSGLTPGTAYWIDLAAQSITTVSAMGLANVTVTVVEL